jgi:nitrile hydratase accessory protein
LNQPDLTPEPNSGPAHARMPRDETGPVFAEAWNAHAFALAIKLSQLGLFTPREWAAALARELKAAADRGEPDDGSRYYHHFLAALEKLVATKGLTVAGASAPSLT